jgi:ADP-heptose:LPS heptosyltransferase
VIESADAVVNHQDLFHLFGKDADAIAAAFVPLRPDPVVVAELRAHYASRGKPVVGLSWGSSNQAKSAPALRDWRSVLQNVPATFVSLQYGDIGLALKKLRRWAGDNLIHDTSVDQMASMDRFAAQLVALDAVLATSSTVVHLAGALGVPCVIMTEESTLNWPQFSARTPWYPSAVLVRREGRPWSIVLDEAQRQLAAMLKQPSVSRVAP